MAHLPHRGLLGFIGGNRGVFDQCTVKGLFKQAGERGIRRGAAAGVRQLDQHIPGVAALQRVAALFDVLQYQVQLQLVHQFEGR
ncbi:hypothetical protein D3C76_1638230 [compost metagenome]